MSHSVGRIRCIGCGSAPLDLLINFGMAPLAGGFMGRDQPPPDPTYPLRLARCGHCTLMQLLETVSPDLIFSNYSYASSTTRTLIEHFELVAGDLIDRADAKGRLVVEFGCNDGILMRPLLRKGAVAVGVDPSDVARAASVTQGWPLFQGYFGREIAEQIRSIYGLARVVTGNNVFAHTDDLDAILKAADLLLEDEGLFVVEVHYQGDLIELNQFDTIYHEHVCYHSLASLCALFARHRLRVIDAARIPIHGGSIHVTAAREKSRWATEESVAAMLEQERSWDVAAFVARVNRIRTAIPELVRGLRAKGESVVAYGASGRATMLLNICGLGSEFVDYVVDMSPLRYGKLVPGVRIPVVPPSEFEEKRPDWAIMTAWNYESEILAKEQNFLRSGGQFIVPLPEIRIVGTPK